MTSPITPDPSIHNIPAADQAQSNKAFIAQLEQLFAQIPKIVLDEVVAFIKGATGIDLTSWENFLLGLGSNLGFIGTDFQALISQVSAIVSTITSLLQGGSLTASVPGFPFTFPDTFRDSFTSNPIIVFVSRLLQFLNPINWLEEGWSVANSALQFAEHVLQPTNLLAWLDSVTGLLPDAQAPAILTQLLTTIEAAFEGLPLIGSYLTPIFNVINGLLGIGVNNSSQIAALSSFVYGTDVPGGISFTDQFARANATNLGSNYVQTYYGPGGGNYGISNDSAHWTTSGANSAGCSNRCTTALATNTQSASIVLAQPISVNTTGSNPSFKIKLRCDSTNQNWVEAHIYAVSTAKANVDINYVVGGVTTLVQNFPTALSMSPGDTWEFRAGTIANAREYVLLLNGTIVADCVESGTTSMLDNTVYKYPAFDSLAGTFVAFFFFYQAGPPDVVTFAASDRKPE
jgi:hypothetical protein